MSDTPETEHFACALQMQSMQNQIEELTDMLRNTERGLATMTEQRDRLAEALRHALRFVRAFDSEHESAMDDKWAIQNQCEKALTAVKGGSDE